MSAAVDRRNPKIRRVPLTTLVDICVDESDSGAFQAETANVSGRGMQVRTSHLPNIGDGLVCRFEHGGREVLVEGRVAWRSEGADGGEFGVQFTALDANSAELLTGLGRGQERPRALPAPEDDFEDGDDKHLAKGNRVRLHIEGLGAPMKAAVHDGNSRRVKVGSNLEFLRVGRSVEVECLDGELRRGATVDGVNVVLNPATSVPELVVHLRYEGISPTPAPAVARHVDVDEGESGDEDFEDEEEVAPHGGLHLPPAVEAARVEVGRALGTATRSAIEVGTSLASALRGATDRVSQSIGERLGERAKKKTAPRTSPSRSTFSAPVEGRPGGHSAVRRQTARPVRAPAHLRSGIHDLGMTARRSEAPSSRPGARSSRAPEAPAPSRSFGKIGVYAALGVAVFGSALLLRGVLGGDEPPADAKVAKAEVADGALPAAGDPPASTDGVTLAKIETAKAPPAKPAHPDGISTNVPLFGERRIVEDVPDESKPEMSEAELEKLAAAASVKDEAFEDEPEPLSASTDAWGRGKMHLPTIHRIRLDGPGTAISGSVDPSGFSVVVRGRKAMENGSVIQKRDSRIAQVKTSGAPDGAKITFSFRGPVPAYRVRLRKDFVEFLISAPESTASL